ncbi:MAG: hypothetical protein QNJ00_05260 [Woeseiaceae bacterium]|nr:hypothetical protein [Woeseiaceae bacterium]
MLTTLTYIIYISLSIGITVYVSRTLSKNGLPFLVDGFGGNTVLAESTNHLLVVGFYLINLGFVLLRMRTGMTIYDVNELIVYQASGLGLVLLVLGFMHFFNMFVIHRFVRSARTRREHIDDYLGSAP